MLFPHHKIPDFLCLGVRKSATSWIWKNLVAHPEICIPSKEINFFKEDKPLKEYLDLFKNCGNKITGELTPDYIFYKNAPEKIKMVNPNVKLFVILRNPIDRAYSQWKFAQFLGYAQTPFIDMWNQDIYGIRTRGHYSEQLENYKKSKFKNFEIYLYDDLISDPKLFICRIYKYLGVDDTFVPPLLNKRYYPTGSHERPEDFLNFTKHFSFLEEDRNVLKKYYIQWIDKTEKIVGRYLGMWKL